jgi:hypothetical protein
MSGMCSASSEECTRQWPWTIFLVIFRDSIVKRKKLTRNLSSGPEIEIRNAEQQTGSSGGLL